MIVYEEKKKQNANNVDQFTYHTKHSRLEITYKSFEKARLSSKRSNSMSVSTSNNEDTYI